MIFHKQSHFQNKPLLYIFRRQFNKQFWFHKVAIIGDFEGEKIEMLVRKRKKNLLLFGTLDFEKSSALIAKPRLTDSY